MADNVSNSAVTNRYTLSKKGIFIMLKRKVVIAALLLALLATGYGFATHRAEIENGFVHATSLADPILPPIGPSPK